jgi:C_GCAxxG_C_C family probable redox protein
MDKKTMCAEKNFEEGFNCAQSVLMAFCEDYGLDKKQAARVSNAFGAGLSKTGNVCGALSAAAMVIGLEHGKEHAEDADSQDKTYDLTGRLVEEFEEKCGATQCKELLGYDMSKPDELEKVKEGDIAQKVCPLYIRMAVELAEKYRKK